MRKIEPSISLLLSLGILTSSVASAPAGTRGASASPAAVPNLLLANDLFNPEAARSALPELGRLDRWIQTDAGSRIAQENLDAGDRKWLDLFLNINDSNLEKRQLAVISPVIQKIKGSPAEERIKKNIDKLVSADPEDQTAIFGAIIKNFKGARRSASSTVAAAIQKVKKEFDSKLKQPDVDAESLSKEAAELREMLEPITLMYGSATTNYSKFQALGKTLAKAEFAHAQKIVDLHIKGDLPPDDPRVNALSHMNPETVSPHAAWIQPAKKTPEAPGSIAPHQKSPKEIPLTRPPDGPTILVFDHPEMIEIAPGVSAKRVVSPIFPDGKKTDIPRLLEAGNLAAEEAFISMYEEGLDPDVDSIIKAVKGGAKFTITADYSQLFPKKGNRTPQYDKLVKFFLSQTPTAKNWDGLGLRLYVVKGKGSIGINHNKYRAWKLKDGRWILQQGSFNYTPTSQANHWENVTFIDDPRAVRLYQSYFNWQVKAARRFEEGLQPEEPNLIIPIIRDTDLTQRYGGEPWPLASFSPDGDVEEYEVKALEKSLKDFMYVMFGVYPTPRVIAAIIKLLTETDAGFRLLADYGQAHNAASIAFMKKILELRSGSVRLTSGPNETPWKDGQRHNPHEKLHNKIVKGKLEIGGSIQTLVGSGSTNESQNAFFKNFENRFWFLSTDPMFAVYTALFDEFTEALWVLGFEPDFSHFNASKFESHAAGQEHVPSMN